MVAVNRSRRSPTKCHARGAAILALVAAPGFGQAFPENHYLVYNVLDPLDYHADLQLQDQWGGWEGPQDLVLTKFANPLWEIGQSHSRWSL